MSVSHSLGRKRNAVVTRRACQPPREQKTTGEIDDGDIGPRRRAAIDDILCLSLKHDCTIGNASESVISQTA